MGLWAIPYHISLHSQIGALRGHRVFPLNFWKTGICKKVGPFRKKFLKQKIGALYCCNRIHNWLHPTFVHILGTTVFAKFQVKNSIGKKVGPFRKKNLHYFWRHPSPTVDRNHHCTLRGTPVSPHRGAVT